MRRHNKQRLYKIPLEFHGGISRTVDVKAASREAAERRALKRNPTAVRVKS